MALAFQACWIAKRTTIIQQGVKCMKALFHLAYHVHDLDQARQFSAGILGCSEGRSTTTWVDFDFFNTDTLGRVSPFIPSEIVGWTFELLFLVLRFAMFVMSQADTDTWHELSELDLERKLSISQVWVENLSPLRVGLIVRSQLVA